MFNQLSNFTSQELGHQVIPLGLVSNGALINRSYREALEYQFDRELVQNAIEAQATFVQISPDWIHLAECKRLNLPLTYRYLFADNGIGMSKTQIESYFNNLSSSGHDLSEFSNFGVGAKISLLPWNTEGIIVMSWHKDNPEGSMIRIIQRPSDKNYGLFLWTDGDGVYQKVIAPPVAYKQMFLSGSETGTIIVALGSSPTEDTFFGPMYKGVVGSPTSPVHTRFLNTRYFTIKNDVLIKTILFQNADKDLWPKDPTDNADNTKFLRAHAKGTKYLLDKLATTSGTVDVSDAKVHWWICEPEKLDSGRPFHKSSFIAALFENELYNTQVSKNARSRFNQFGLLFEEVKRRVVLVVEPTVGLQTTYYPNTSRSALMYADNESLELPWAKWGIEFLANMPRDIKDLCAKYGSSLDTPKKSIKDRLKEFLIRLQPMFMKQPEGNNGSNTSALVIPLLKEYLKGGRNKLKSKDRSSNPKTEGTENNAKKVTPKTEPPMPIWVRAVDMSEEYFAAEYVESSNTVKINSEFFLFKEVMEYWLTKYPEVPGADLKISEIVKDVYQLKLIAVIIHAYSMGTKLEWARSWRTLMAPEALTASILGIINEHTNILSRLSGLGIKSHKNK